MARFTSAAKTVADTLLVLQSGITGAELTTAISQAWSVMSPAAGRRYRRALRMHAMRLRNRANYHPRFYGWATACERLALMHELFNIQCIK